MKKLYKFARTLTATFAIAAFSTAAWAAGPPECGLIGTWYGADAGSDLVWLGVHTPGTHNSKGEMLMDWVTNNMVSPPARMTDGRGVWEQTGKGKYNYTWYAFMIDDSTGQMLQVVVNGTAANLDCNNIEIRYRFRVYDDAETLVYVTPPLDRDPGYAYETRVPMATP